MLIIKLLRPEKIMQASSSYVADQLGKFYDQVVNPTMEDVYNASDCKTPIIFILSPGADPTSLLFKLAKEKNK